MNDSYKILFSLLKIALGNANATDYNVENVNWQEIKDIAIRQGVYGVAFDAFSKVPNSYRPVGKVFYEWLGLVLAMERSYQQYSQTLFALTKIVTGLQLRMMVLKGWGCAINYPHPEHRPCGDIDIFIVDHAGKHLDEYARRLENFLKVKVNEQNSHHSQFFFHHFLIENHSTILDVDTHKSSIGLNRLLENLVATYRLVGEVAVCLPSVKFNSIHLLRHMANDFASVRISLRQVLDWATFVVKANQDVEGLDWTFVHTVATKANMHRFLDAINGICIYSLGFSAECFPIVKRDENLERRILAEIFLCKDSAEQPIENGSFLKKLRYGLLKTRRMWRNRWKYEIVYDESILDSFCWKARNRLKSMHK